MKKRPHRSPEERTRLIEELRSLVTSGLPITQATKKLGVADSFYYSHIGTNKKSQAKTTKVKMIDLPQMVDVPTKSIAKLMIFSGTAQELATFAKGML